MADFATAFNGSTDLIYGMGDQINRYIIYVLKGKKYDHVFGKNRTEAIEWKEKKGWAINSFNEHMNNIDYVKSQEGLYGDYWKAILGSSYKPAHESVSSTPSPKELKSLSKSNADLDDNSSAKEIRNAAFDLSIRRSCKFGIEFTTQKLAGRIHYVLDGMTLDALLDKRTITNGSGYEKVPICTSELRFLFRNWNKFKDSGKVVFWQDFDVVAPPWYRAVYVDGWRNYGLERLEKYWKVIDKAGGFKKLLADAKIADTNDFKNVRPHFAGMKSIDFLRLFHMIPVQFSNKESVVIT